MPSCRICGCTDDHACPGGCHWVEPDLCSACDDNIGTAAGFVDGMLAREPDGPCPAAAIAVPHQVLWRDAHAGHCVRCRDEFRA